MTKVTTIRKGVRLRQFPRRLARDRVRPTPCRSRVARQGRVCSGSARVVGVRCAAHAVLPSEAITSRARPARHACARPGRHPPSAPCPATPVSLANRREASRPPDDAILTETSGTLQVGGRVRPLWSRTTRADVCPVTLCRPGGLDAFRPFLFPARAGREWVHADPGGRRRRQGCGGAEDGPRRRGLRRRGFADGRRRLLPRHHRAVRRGAARSSPGCAAEVSAFPSSSSRHETPSMIG
jgi:hypothetical protein